MPRMTIVRVVPNLEKSLIVVPRRGSEHGSSPFFLNSPVSMGSTILRIAVNRSNPMDQIPIDTRISIVVGAYSHISPKGAGMNPGIINPIPFSIQMPTMIRTQPKFRVG